MFEANSSKGIPNLRLYDEYNRRLYLNTEERLRFIDAARVAETPIKEFALTLAYTGCRISEACNLKAQALQSEARCLSIRSLKKRQKLSVREVPIPAELVNELSGITEVSSEYFWSGPKGPVARISAYRWIKSIMNAAELVGAHACPKGLRHGYGVNATLSGVQIHMLQRWMGHTSIQTTAIYATVLGPDQLKVADRMWVE